MSDRSRYLYRLLSPFVSVVYMKVRTTNAAFFDADHDVINAHFGLRYIFDPQSGFGFAFYDCFHLVGVFVI